MILDEIVACRRVNLAELKRETSLSDIEAAARREPPARDFAGAITRRSGESMPRVIAEIKHASPSKGLLSSDFDPARLAGAYAAGGASALSVLTEPRYFLGDLAHLRIARDAAGLPALRKDFLFDPYQVFEARAAGADAVLLIVAMLDDALLKVLAVLTSDLGMAALVEVHSEPELERALAAEARIIGVNNRDLQTFSVDLGVTERLARLVPAGKLLVAESGIHTRSDVERVAAVGASAILVGEALVRSGEPAAKLEELVG